LVASATRRKSIPPSSPLANIAEDVGSAEKDGTPNTAAAATTLPKDKDGDVVMSESVPPTTSAAQASQSGSPMFTLSNPSTLNLTSSITNSISGSAPVVTLKEMIKKSKRAKTSHSHSHGQSHGQPKPASALAGAAAGTAGATGVVGKEKDFSKGKANKKGKGMLQLETVVEEDGISMDVSVGLEVEMHGDGGHENVDVDIAEFEPLRRVPSRDSGYCSIGVLQNV
jgi:hypothetical protein